MIVALTIAIFYLTRSAARFPPFPPVRSIYRQYTTQSWEQLPSPPDLKCSDIHRHGNKIAVLLPSCGLFITRNDSWRLDIHAADEKGVREWRSKAPMQSFRTAPFILIESLLTGYPWYPDNYCFDILLVSAHKLLQTWLFHSPMSSFSKDIMDYFIFQLYNVALVRKCAQSVINFDIMEDFSLELKWGMSRTQGLIRLHGLVGMVAIQNNHINALAFYSYHAIKTFHFRQVTAADITGNTLWHHRLSSDFRWDKV